MYWITVLIPSCMWPALILCLLIVTGFRNDRDSVACHVAFNVLSVRVENLSLLPWCCEDQEVVLRNLKLCI